MFRNLFKKVKVEPKVEVEKGDIISKPKNSEAARNGFTKYAKIEDFYEVIDVNENGIMFRKFIADDDDILEKGSQYNKDTFMSHEDLNYRINDRYYLRPSEESKKQFFEAIDNFKQVSKEKLSEKLKRKVQIINKINEFNYRIYFESDDSEYPTESVEMSRKELNNLWNEKNLENE